MFDTSICRMILLHVGISVPMQIIQNLVGGLEHEIYFSIYWECHHPN